jgi:anaerobic magnesium-protoporphyrin IX monomethyl ester cyclase
MLRIAPFDAPLQSAVCDYGVGHQMPLGLLMVGGALLDAGYPVTLIDAVALHLPDREIAERVRHFSADVVMIAHVGSTQAHPCCMRTLRAIKAALPHVVTVYGGGWGRYGRRSIVPWRRRGGARCWCWSRPACPRRGRRWRSSPRGRRGRG